MTKLLHDTYIFLGGNMGRLTCNVGCASCRKAQLSRRSKNKALLGIFVARVLPHWLRQVLWNAILGHECNSRSKTGPEIPRVGASGMLLAGKEGVQPKTSCLWICDVFLSFATIHRGILSRTLVRDSRAYLRRPP